GVDFRLPADTGSAAAVTPAHEVAELAFNLGSVGPVVGLPVRIGLALTGACEGGFELADADGAAPGGVSALVAQWTAGAVLGEVGDATAVSAAADGHAHPGGAGDGVVIEVDVEAVLAEAAGRRRRRLGPATRVDVLVVESLLELAGPIGGIAVDLGVLGAVLAV